MNKIEGYFNFVVAENVCNRQKRAWQNPQTIYIIDQHQQPSRYKHVCLSVRMKTAISEVSTKFGSSILFLNENQVCFRPPFIDKNRNRSVIYQHIISINDQILSENLVVIG